MLDISVWRKFRVISLDAAGLKQAAGELARQAHEFQPDVIVGIRSGGYRVAAHMAESLQQVALLPITCRRPSTQKKESLLLLRKLLQKLPYAVTDRLRVAEHIVLTQLRAPKPVTAGFVPDAQELTALKQWLGSKDGAARILIVDDAVDSGATLAAVHRLVQSVAYPGSTVKMAAITVTTQYPLIQPDFVLYRYALCRFPWSLDTKERDRTNI
jgi:uncharacterized protein